MNKANRIELKYSIFSWGMLAAFIAGIFLLFQGIWDDLVLNIRNQGQFLTMKYISSMHSAGVFDILAPVLAVLPAATSFCDEFESGYIKFIQLRVTRKSYIMSKVVAVGISGGFAVGLPVLLANILLLLIGDKYSIGLKGNYDVDIFADSIFKNIEYIGGGWLVAIAITGCTFLFGMAWALAGLAISTLIINRYAALFLPFSIYFAAFMIFARFNLYMFSPINLICPDMSFIPSVAFVLGYMIFLVVLFMGASIAGICRRWNQ